MLYDSVAGGAGYCQLAQQRGLKPLLEEAVRLLDCECEDSCRLCLRDYDNERFWEDFKRQSVLAWLKKLLRQAPAPNPFSRFRAVELITADPAATFWAELENASHATVITTSLFDFTRGEAADAETTAAAPAQFIKRLVHWMTGGRTLEIALLAAPSVSDNHVESLAAAKWLEPCLQTGHLKLFKLPPNFDALNWPRVMLNSGKDSARCLFTRAGLTAAFVRQPLAAPLWKSPGLSQGELQGLRAQWQPLPPRLTEPGSKTTLREYQPGEARDFACDFEFCKGKKFSMVRIEDPFALATEGAVSSMTRFIEDLKALSGQWPDEVRIQARENPDFRCQTAARTAQEKHFQAAGLPKLAICLVPRFSSRRRDFHDRRIVFVPDARKPQNRITVLLTGGIDRYMDPRFECAVIVHRTGL